MKQYVLFPNREDKTAFQIFCTSYTPLSYSSNSCTCRSCHLSFNSIHLNKRQLHI